MKIIKFSACILLGILLGLTTSEILSPSYSLLSDITFVLAYIIGLYLYKE